MKLVYELKEINGEMQYVSVEWTQDAEPTALYLDINDSKHIELLKSILSSTIEI